jgi:DNA-binding MarR family transcriptional regulator
MIEISYVQEVADSAQARKRAAVDGYPKALAARVGFLLARAHLVAREKADSALGGVGLSMKGYAALATLVSDGPISQQKLSRRIRMDPATMVDVIDSLEASGHIVRRRNPEDRREYALQTTSKGRALLTRAQRAIEAAERDTVRGLEPEEAAVLMELLGRIADPSRSTNLATDELVAEVLGR